MAKVKEEMEVPKEINEVGIAIKKVIEVATKALEDGFQAGQDIPTVMLGSFKELSVALAGVDQMDDEFKEDAVGSVMGALIPISEGLKILLERKKVGVISAAKVVGDKKAK